MDGAFCEYSEAAKLGWLADLAENKGAINCEMEAAIFLSLCQRAGVSATVACVALLNRKGLTLANDRSFGETEKQFAR